MKPAAAILLVLLLVGALWPALRSFLPGLGSSYFFWLGLAYLVMALTELVRTGAATWITLSRASSRIGGGWRFRLTSAALDSERNLPSRILVRIAFASALATAALAWPLFAFGRWRFSKEIERLNGEQGAKRMARALISDTVSHCLHAGVMALLAIALSVSILVCDLNASPRLISGILVAYVFFSLASFALAPRTLVARLRQQPVNAYAQLASLGILYLLILTVGLSGISGAFTTGALFETGKYLVSNGELSKLIDPTLLPTNLGRLLFASVIIQVARQWRYLKRTHEDELVVAVNYLVVGNTEAAEKWSLGLSAPSEQLYELRCALRYHDGDLPGARRYLDSIVGLIVSDWPRPPTKEERDLLMTNAGVASPLLPPKFASELTDEFLSANRRLAHLLSLCDALYLSGRKSLVGLATLLERTPGAHATAAKALMLINARSFSEALKSLASLDEKAFVAADKVALCTIELLSAFATARVEQRRERIHDWCSRRLGPCVSAAAEASASDDILGEAQCWMLLLLAANLLSKFAPEDSEAISKAASQLATRLERTALGRAVLRIGPVARKQVGMMPQQALA